MLEKPFVKDIFKSFRKTRKYINRTVVRGVRADTLHIHRLYVGVLPTGRKGKC